MLKRKSTVLGGRPLVSVGYKYNMWKVISFIATEDAGSAKAGIPYLSEYSGLFANVFICPIARPLAMFKFFGSVNEVESHKKSIQSYLALEKYWVAQCSWLWLCTTVDVEMTITTFWKLFVMGL